MIVGDKFEESFFVSNDTYEGFIKIFDDKNPMHTDKKFATSNGFKDVVMHGNILGGYVSYFVGECLPLKNVVIVAQKLSFHHPFYREEKVKLKAEVKEIYDSVNLIDFKLKFYNEMEQLVAKGSLQIKVLQ